MLRRFLTALVLSLVLANVATLPVIAGTALPKNVPNGWTELPLATTDPAILCKTFHDGVIESGNNGIAGVSTGSLDDWQEDPSVSHVVTASAAIKSVLSLSVSFGGYTVSSIKLKSLQVSAPRNITDCSLDGGKFISAALKVASLSATVTQGSGTAPSSSPSTSASASPNGITAVICPTSGGDLTSLLSATAKVAAKALCDIIGSPQYNVQTRANTTTTIDGTNLFIAIQLIEPHLTGKGRSNLTTGNWTGTFARVMDGHRTAGYNVLASAVDPNTYKTGDLIHLGRHFCANLTVTRDSAPTSGNVIFCPPKSMISDSGAVTQLKDWDPFDAPIEFVSQDRPVLYFYTNFGNSISLTTVSLSVNSPATFTFVGFPIGGMPPIGNAVANVLLHERVYDVHR